MTKLKESKSIEEKLQGLPEYEKMKVIMNRPNFFSILKMESTEIRHSNFLSWLLDPNESHGLGEIFLKWFLMELTYIKDSFLSLSRINNIVWSKVKLFREESSEKGKKRLDILIVYDCPNAKDFFTVSIENKIFSKEHGKQLNEYFDMVTNRSCDNLKGKPKNNKDLFVYLTPFGDDPKNDSHKTYIPFSYEKIAERLDFVLDVYRSNMMPRTAAYIEDYRNILSRNVLGTDLELQRLSEEILEKEPLMNGKKFNSEDNVVKYARKYKDVNKLIKDSLKKSKIFGENRTIEIASCSSRYVRFIPNDLKQLLEPIEKLNRERQQFPHWPNYEVFLFELDVRREYSRSKEGEITDYENYKMKANIKAVVGPFGAHDKMVEFLNEQDNLKDLGLSNRASGFYHSVLSKSIATIKEIKVTKGNEQEFVQKLKEEIEKKKKTLEHIAKAVADWCKNKFSDKE